MEEEPNEHELEERLYAMLHHVDETQANVNTDSQNDAARYLENAPRSTIRRYWRTNSEHASNNNPYFKVNTPKENVPAPVNKNPLTTTNTNNTKPKEEKNGKPEPTVDLSLFQSPPQIVKKTIEILEHENDSFVLESSDEDEVVEVELPPKPTITIESSDEDDCVISKPDTPSKDQLQNNVPGNGTPATVEREVSASPVPSVVSSVSDEFIRGDCIALNISSRHHDNHSFDFSLHGSDLLGQVTPSKKKKKKKSKEAVTSTPLRQAAEKPSSASGDTCFATPKSKAKNKKQKAKSYTVSEKSLPSADVYDSDSNQSAIEPIKDSASNNATEKSLPDVDIYESDVSLSENNTNKNKSLQNDQVDESFDTSTLDPSNKDKTKSSKRNDTTESYKTADSIVDLTDTSDYITLDTSDICENIVMANVTGFKESEDYGDKVSSNDAPKFGSTKVPQILFENLDFDNLKGKDKVCKRRKYSLTTLRAEMEKFYNESWGGEDFNHREIQKYMSRDKSLWVIDPKDRMPAMSKRKVTCNYCNRPGHRDDTCRHKPPVCYMCGSTGHYEPRCPSKICVNCGSPNYMYSTMCRNCASWGRMTCAECGQGGHPSSHCPDIWRRYHNTISSNMPLAENRQTKKAGQMYCSGCTRRGHLVHSCRTTLPFSGLPLNSPYVAFYRPVFMPTIEEPDNEAPRQQLNKTIPQDSAVSSPAINRNERNKRQSKSPTMHETHQNKKKNMTITDIVEMPERQKTSEGRQRKNSQGKNQMEENKTSKELNKSADTPRPQPAGVEPALDFIPISTNTDKQGQMIQDNEVSDTSDVVTSARIYVTNEIIHRLKTPEGQFWLNENKLKHDVSVQITDINAFLSIKGKFADQEAFQYDLREWSKPTTDKENPKSDNEGDVSFLSEEDQLNSSNIPKHRNTVLRKLSKALESLKDDLGDPKDIYKELNFLQNKHDNLLQQKVISPKQLSNNRDHINAMLKKLNMVLLGQAGLADGSEHLSELHSLREKLTNFRQKQISLNMRKEIGKHYHSIFTPIPRNDYADLLNMYYVASKEKILNRRNKDKLQVVTKKRKRQRRNINPVAAGQTQSFPTITKNDERQVVVHKENTHSRKNYEHISVNKLIFYHRRILNTRPADSVLKKTRMELTRKLHSHIASLNRNEAMSSKAMKKVKRVQEQAALFLSNV